MRREQARLLTIVAERTLEGPLKELVERAGAEGYSIVESVSGMGRHGERSGPIAGSGNIQMTLAVSNHTAEAILEAIEKEYGKSYAIIAFLHDVELIHWTV